MSVGTPNSTGTARPVGVTCTNKDSDAVPNVAATSRPVGVTCNGIVSVGAPKVGVTVNPVGFTSNPAPANVRLRKLELSAQKRQTAASRKARGLAPA